MIVTAAGLLLVNSITASENRRLKSAQKDYADAKYALAGEEFKELRKSFPKSEHADLYDFFAALSEYASWGYFDPGKNNYVDGYQSPPVNWTINTERKRSFFKLLAELTGADASDPTR